ncbi:hypothetical protein T07_15292 [Trichinella nelsoni]|uniref:Uncharacterized protein n=1 Tax=Trichinella nelsoni TaxID=6336 RepID=A0A0V0RGG7_9BILA|nr:hypothetical protein T07_15292 [Trichinella nelsoni]
MRVHTVKVPLFILNSDDEHLLLNVIYCCTERCILKFHLLCIAFSNVNSCKNEMDSEDEMQMRCQLKYPNLWYPSSGTITQRLIAEGIHKCDMQSNRSILISRFRLQICQDLLLLFLCLGFISTTFKYII